MFNSSTTGGYSLADIAAATRGGSYGGGMGSGFFGDSGWWIILLFLFALGGWGNNGSWGNGGGMSGAPVMIDNTITRGLDTQDIRNGIADLTASTANGFYNLNSSIAGVNAAVAAGTSTIQHDLCDSALANCQSTNAIISAINAGTTAGLQNTFTLAQQMNGMQAAQQLANCQTDQMISSALAQLDYNIATENCADRTALTTGVRDIIDAGNANTRSILDFLVQDRISALQSENAALKMQASQADQNAYLLSQLRPSPIPAYPVANPYSSCGCGYTTGCCGNMIG